MDCKDVIELLSAYVDGELEEVQCEHVASHLDKCPDCRTQFAAIKKAISMIHSLDELDVPLAVSRPLRQVAKNEAGNSDKLRRWWMMPALRYTVAAGAVAAIALVVALSQFDIGALDKVASTRHAEVEIGESAKKEPDKNTGIIEKGLPGSPAQSFDASKSAAPANPEESLSASQSRAFGSNNVTAENQDSAREAAKTYVLDANRWPKLEVSKKNYDAASADNLLDSIKRETDGLYTVKDAKDMRSATIGVLIGKVNERGGEGEYLRSPINALLDRTKRSALPVYLEKAKFNKKDCWLIIIRWGFGDDRNDLYKASLYVTDLSGWNIMHYSSK